MRNQLKVRTVKSSFVTDRLTVGLPEDIVADAGNPAYWILHTIQTRNGIKVVLTAQDKRGPPA